MAIPDDTWEAMVRQARRQAPEVGTVRAIRNAMYDWEMRFRNEDAEYHFVIRMYRAIADPPPGKWDAQDMIPPVPRSDDPIERPTVPEIRRIPALNMPRSEDAMVGPEVARRARREFYQRPSARIPGTASDRLRRDRPAPEPEALSVRLIKRQPGERL